MEVHIFFGYNLNSILNAAFPTNFFGRKNRQFFIAPPFFWKYCFFFSFKAVLFYVCTKLRPPDVPQMVAGIHAGPTWTWCGGLQETFFIIIYNITQFKEYGIKIKSQI